MAIMDLPHQRDPLERESFNRTGISFLFHLLIDYYSISMPLKEPEKLTASWSKPKEVP